MSDTLVLTKTFPLPAQPSAHLALRAPAEHDALVPGTRLDEFEIVRVLGAGGFGIVYLALDHVLQRQVAIKEYMPSALAGRGEGAAVAMRSPDSAETFALGLESFFNEARFLACFDHPSLVKVYRCMKAHGTAYMVMPYYPGITLKQARRGMAAAPDGAWLRAFVEPLLDVLELLHAQGVFHRDIAPDNILLLPDGRPVLLDFGSARRIVGDATQSLTAVLKPNFAPIEQYADTPGMRQGPWTDVYALGATVYFMLIGEAPAPAVLRAVRDALPTLSRIDGDAFAGVPQHFLATIDWSLALSPDDRPQSVDSLRQALEGRRLPPLPSPRQPIDSHRPSHEVGAAHTVDATAAFVSSAFTDTVTVNTAKVLKVPPYAALSNVAPPRRHMRVALALALCGVAACVVLGWQLATPSAALPAALSATTTSSAPAALPAPAATDAFASTRASTPASPVAAASTSAAAVQRSNGAARDGTASAPSRPPSPSPSLQRAAAPGAAGGGPKAACNDLNFFTRAMCISRECQDSRWRAHPQCAQARAIEEQRQRHKDQL